MKKLILITYTIFNFSYTAICQSKDTLAAKIIWIKDLKECLLIGVVSVCNANDTSVFISQANGVKRNKRIKMDIGQIYIFNVEKDLAIASPSKKMSVSFKNTVVWTSKESYKLKPRLCFNCIGEYIK